MKVERTDLSPTKVTIKVSGDAGDLEPIKRHTLAHFRHSVKVPGFRAGAAPMAMIEKNIDQQQLLDEFLEHALNQLYRAAIEQQKIRPVGSPQVSLKKFVPFTSLQFEATTEVIGGIKLADYKNIKLSIPVVNVTTKDVSDVIVSLQQRAASRKAVDRPAKKGDEVIVDFSGKDSEGNPIGGADVKDYPLILGSGSFIPGFEENVLALKPSDAKIFAIIFPKDYGAAALQGKEVTFEVTVKKVNELDVSNTDDKFAAAVGPFMSLAELKADIKKQLRHERQTQAEKDLSNRLVGEITTKSSVEIPEGLVEEEITRLEDEEKRNLTYRGQTWQEHLKQEGITEQEHRERHRPEARDRLKAGIVLGEIADKENITVTTDEVDERIKLLKGQHQDAAMQAELDKPNARRDIEARLMTEKTIEKLTKYAS